MREQSPKDAKNGTPASRMDGRKFLPVDCTEEAAYNEGRKKQVNQAEMEEGAELCDGVEVNENRNIKERQNRICEIIRWAEDQDRISIRLCDLVERLLATRRNP